MKFTRVLLLSSLLVCLLALAAPASTPADAIERLVLIDGKMADGWTAVESTLTPTAVEGVPALLFGVKVDWSAGEPDYPIGWPRIEMNVPVGRGDWRQWEQMRLKVYALTDRGPLPRRPLGVNVRTPVRNGWEREAEELPAGQWREFTFDLRDIPERDKVESIGIFISEDAYPDGETLRFYISDLELIRYTKPTLAGSNLLAAVSFADSKALPLAVEMLGVKESASAPVLLRLMAGDRTLAQTEAHVPEGVTQVSLPLPAGLHPGEYTVVVSSGGRERSHPLKLVPSPWEGGVQ
jgi:hypothetical protein